MPDFKAIETKYKGHRFRSRLEARYAVFFDALSVPWQYEHEGFQYGDDLRYLPDFYLPKFDVFVEIKPTLPTEYFVRHNDKWVAQISTESGPTPFGKWLVAALHLAESATGDLPILRQRMFMACGTPGLPKLQRDSGGKWELQSGCVLLSCPLHGCGGLPMSLWSMKDGELDIWPFYMEGNPSRAKGDVYSVPWFPDLLVKNKYLGPGREFSCGPLHIAYEAARSARF